MKLFVIATAPFGSRAINSTVPLVNEFAVHFTVAVIVVLTFCTTGFGDAVAEEVKLGGTSGVAAIGDDAGPVPALLVPETS